MRLPPPRRGMVREAIVYVLSVTLTFAVLGAFVGAVAALGAP